MGKKITPDLLDAWLRLVPKLGERQAAIDLDRSQSGFRAALHKRDHAPVRKDRRGNTKIFTKAWNKTKSCIQGESEIELWESDREVRETKIEN